MLGEITPKRAEGEKNHDYSYATRHFLRYTLKVKLSVMVLVGLITSPWPLVENSILIARIHGVNRMTGLFVFV